MAIERESHVDGTTADADAPPVRGVWLKDRVGSFQEQTKQRWLHNAVCTSTCNASHLGLSHTIDEHHRTRSLAVLGCHRRHPALAGLGWD